MAATTQRQCKLHYLTSMMLRTSNVTPRHIAGCCHLANLMACFYRATGRLLLKFHAESFTRFPEMLTWLHRLYTKLQTNVNTDDVSLQSYKHWRYIHSRQTVNEGVSEWVTDRPPRTDYGQTDRQTREQWVLSEWVAGLSSHSTDNTSF